MSRVLVLLSEDKPLIAQMNTSFEREGYTMWVAETERSLHYLARTVEPTHIIIDSELYYQSADLCADLRRTKFNGCLMVLVPESMKLDGMLSLELGADDYLVKPFDLRELFTRIRAVERRGNFHFVTESNQMIKFGILSLHVDTQTAYVREDPVVLTEKETMLLYALLLHPEKVLTRETLVKLVMSHAEESDIRIIDVFVSRLRQKLTEAGAMIETVRNKGYRLRMEKSSDVSS